MVSLYKGTKIIIHRNRPISSTRRGLTSTMFTHRISVHGGSPLGASISCRSVQATKLPRQAHSTGQRSVLSFTAIAAAFARPNNNVHSRETTSKDASLFLQPPCPAKRRSFSAHRDIAMYTRKRHAQSPTRLNASRDTLTADARFHHRGDPERRRSRATNGLP